MTQRLKRIAQGGIITAEFLNGPVDLLNQAIGGATEGSAQQDLTTTDETPGSTSSDEIYRVSSVQTETVRIEDPDDANTYVDVERVTELVMRERFTGKKIKFLLDGLYD